MSIFLYTCNVMIMKIHCFTSLLDDTVAHLKEPWPQRVITFFSPLFVKLMEHFTKNLSIYVVCWK